jgi:hypothetical protein
MLTPQHTRMDITVKMNPHLHFHFAFEISMLEHLHKRYTPWSVLQDGSMEFVYTQRYRQFLQNPGAVRDHAEAITHLPSPSTCEDSKPVSLRTHEALHTTHATHVTERTDPKTTFQSALTCARASATQHMNQQIPLLNL